MSYGTQAPAAVWCDASSTNCYMLPLPFALDTKWNQKSKSEIPVAVTIGALLN